MSNFTESTPTATPQAPRRLEDINEGFTPDEEVTETSFIKSTPNSEYCIRLVKDVELFGAEENIKVIRMERTDGRMDELTNQLIKPRNHLPTHERTNQPTNQPTNRPIDQITIQLQYPTN